MNYANKAALAALLGITQETHRWLAKKDYVHPNGCGHGNPRHLVGVRLDVSKLPDPLGPDADAVWLAPMMCWMQEHDFNPSVVGLDFGHKSKFKFAADCFSMETMTRTNNLYDDTMTAALLQACRAARVPEVCKILEATHE